MQIDGRLLEESAEELYDGAPCGYVSTLPDGTIVKVNATFLNWTGYRREELIAGMRFQELLSIAGKIFYETHFAPLMQMQGFVNEVAFDLVCADRRQLPVLVNSVQKRDEAGRPLLIRTTLFNATDRRLYERELLLARNKAEQEAKARAELLSMISHDIRAPLSAIITGTKLLERTGISPQQQQKYIGILKASSEMLLHLTNNILDYSKIEAGAVRLEERSFNIRDMLQVIFDSLTAKAEDKKIALVATIEDAVPTQLVGDPVKIGQVVMNLLGNAIKFTEKGSVELRVNVKETHPDAVSLAFSITDTGIGIPTDRLARIFDDFSQASHDIGLKYGGTGLGLAISRRLLALYGAKMQVESAPGEGATFSFVLRLRLSDG